MHVLWFGDAWNTTLCTKEHKTSAPVGSKCIECDGSIVWSDRGVVTSCSPGIWGHWEIERGEVTETVCSYHLGCFLAIVTGNQIEGTKVAERMQGSTQTSHDKRLTEINEASGLIEDAEPGGGWGR